MNNFKRYFAVLSFALVATAARSYADPVATLSINGSNVALVQTYNAGVYTYTFSDSYTNLLDTRTTNFTATYSNVGGLDTLNVTDVCAQVNVLGGTPQPCEAAAFTFTDVAHTSASILSLTNFASGSVSGNVANINFGASVGSSSAQVGFAGSTTPEPGSLALLATGLCGVAGAVRRRLTANA